MSCLLPSNRYRLAAGGFAPNKERLMRAGRLLVVSLLLGCVSGASSAGEKKITVVSRTVVFEGKSFRLPCSQENVTAVLGPPSRVEKLLNEILVWDELGVFA